MTAPLPIHSNIWTHKAGRRGAVPERIAATSSGSIRQIAAASRNRSSNATHKRIGAARDLLGDEGFNAIAAKIVIYDVGPVGVDKIGTLLRALRQFEDRISRSAPALCRG